MTIQVGDSIPQSTLKTMGAEGPQDLTTADIFAGNAFKNGILTVALPQEQDLLLAQVVEQRERLVTVLQLALDQLLLRLMQDQQPVELVVEWLLQRARELQQAPLALDQRLAYFQNH